MPDSPRKKRRWRWSLGALMIGIALLALPMAMLRHWLDLPPCAHTAGGPGLWIRADCAACHASPPPSGTLIATARALGVVATPFDVAGHATSADPTSCIQCHTADR
jgi:hypothetical protein